MISSCIQVCDIETTIMWYGDFLGFQCSYRSSIKSPEYAILEKSGSRLYLRKASDRQVYASNVVVIESQNLEDDYSMASDKGVIIVQEISKGLFGTKEFIVKDYEDNKIVYRQIS
ncbi:hypothetical protein R50072_32270 [Simiduia litorea]|uniref:VOC family protein n=1 Tax=Simiduia litorea TaxID=1435348 RepID=UPI0036F415CA